MNYSEYQTAIFDFFAKGTGNGAGVAVAGSGKTTTAVRAVDFVNPMIDVCFTTFGKDIATTLKQKIKRENTTIATYNSFGWRICCKQMNNKPILETEIYDEGKTLKTLRYGILDDLNNPEDKGRYYKEKNNIKRIISLLKGRLCFDVDTAIKMIPEIIDRHGIDLNPEPWAMEWLLSTFDLCINNTLHFDYDDQKYMPLKLGLNIPQFDFMIVDEWQDTNLLECELMMRACVNGRKFVIGDPMQSIYGFRDATPDSLAKFITEMNAVELPLSVCYRCSKTVIREAQKIVPHIQYAPNAIEGNCDRVPMVDCERRVTEKDFVICRTTEPLIRFVLKCVKQGRAAYIKGKDVGQNLITMIDTIKNNTNMAMSMFSGELEIQINKRIQRHNNLSQFNIVGLIEDQYDMIKVLMSEVDSVLELKQKILFIFKDSGVGIQCMTIHKSKGLQAQNVWLIRKDLIPHKRAIQQWQIAEEQRLLYVGITRAEQGLYYVDKEAGER